MSPVLELARELVARPSVTPADGGCQALVAARLERAGYRVEMLPRGAVQNLWATRGPAGAATLVFVGHTDVVPPGPEAAWTTPPFTPELRAGRLYGRGAADMKGAVAAMVVTLERLAAAAAPQRGRVALLLTSDEEGPALDGLRRVAPELAARGERLDWCLVGEPSAHARLGDRIRVGRRGSLTGRLTVHGVQGHVAYPEQARNPVHTFAPALAELVATRWDAGDDAFPPTSLQVADIRAGTGADNVIPGALHAVFNFRHGPASPAAGLRQRVAALLRRHGVDHEFVWHDSGAPFLAPPDGALRRAVLAACRARLGREPEQDTGGGTSDGRFLAPLGAEVIELGPVGASIHKVDEHVRAADLDVLAALYADVAARLLA